VSRSPTAAKSCRPWLRINIRARRNDRVSRFSDRFGTPNGQASRRNTCGPTNIPDRGSTADRKPPHPPTADNDHNTVPDRNKVRIPDTPCNNRRIQRCRARRQIDQQQAGSHFHFRYWDPGDDLRAPVPQRTDFVPVCSKQRLGQAWRRPLLRSRLYWRRPRDCRVVRTLPQCPMRF
jgi:hypothetical protein